MCWLKTVEILRIFQLVSLFQRGDKDWVPLKKVILNGGPWTRSFNIIFHLLEMQGASTLSNTSEWELPRAKSQ